MNEVEAANRVIEFLERCGESDIQAGVGYIIGCGSPERIAAFVQGIADAIKAEELL